MQTFLKKSFILIADLTSIIIPVFVLMELEYDVIFLSTNQNIKFIATVLGLYCFFWFLVNEDKSVYRYFSNKNLIEHFIRCFFSFLISSIIFYNLDLNSLKDTCFLSIMSTLFVYIYRHLIKSYKLKLKKDRNTKTNGDKINILIYGAGDAGIQLEYSLRKHNFYNIVGFVDDNKSLHGRLVNKKVVYDRERIKFLKDKFNVKGIVFAMPSIDENILKQYSRFCLDLKLFVTKVPSIKRLIHGYNNINELKLFDSNDLLSREEVDHFYKDGITNINRSVVAITGGGGSIGSEICHQLIKLKVKKIIIIDNHEYSLFKIQKFLETQFKNNIFVSYLADVRDRATIERIFLSEKVKVVYHAAAYKHVEMLQTNVYSAVKINIIGTYNALVAAKNSNVKNFVLISTDKAVNPSNIMGATKRFAEIIVSSKSKSLLKNQQLNTSIVRFGNVLGSKGSVIPILMKQIELGGPLTITDPEATRYFMTIKEAVQLVILASTISREHRTYILEMGKQKNILKLAKELILMNGLIPTLGKNKKYGEMNIVFTGLKKGEKLEEKLFISDKLHGTSFEKIKFINEPTLDETKLEQTLKKIIFDLKNQNILSLKKTLKLHTSLKD